jgi:hypothetical protein
MQPWPQKIIPKRTHAGIFPFYGDFEINGNVRVHLAGSYSKGNYMAYQISIHMQYPNLLPAYSSDPEWAKYIVYWSGARPKKLKLIRQTCIRNLHIIATLTS